MKASEWIDRVKTAKGWPSDYRAAKELGFKANTISTYRASGAPMDETISLKVAEALAIDPIIILADQAMERAKDETARSAWAGILAKLGVGQEKTPTPSGEGVQTSWRKRRDSNPR